jgi:hypothetical protein
MIGPDFLNGLERRAMIVTVLLAVGALVWPSAGMMTALGVLGGALIAGISYFGVRRGVDGLTAALSGGASARAGILRTLIMLLGRYALLAVIAYVMIARLRVSPLGLLLGVSVIPLAAASEVFAAKGTKNPVRGDHGKV